MCAYRFFLNIIFLQNFENLLTFKCGFSLYESNWKYALINWKSKIGPHSSPYVSGSPHVTTVELLNGFSWTLIFFAFYKICRHATVWLKSEINIVPLTWINACVFACIAMFIGTKWCRDRRYREQVRKHTHRVPIVAHLIVFM
jgi:hypothetical protein